MKVTKEYLKQVINEEINKLKELIEPYPGYGKYTSTNKTNDVQTPEQLHAIDSLIISYIAKPGNGETLKNVNDFYSLGNFMFRIANDYALDNKNSYKPYDNNEKLYNKLINLGKSFSSIGTPQGEKNAEIFLQSTPDVLKKKFEDILLNVRK